MRRGQVALYLVMVLVAIAVMMFANVNMFLAVRAKNRMMNAVDEAAIAAALIAELGPAKIWRRRVSEARKALYFLASFLMSFWYVPSRSAFVSSSAKWFMLRQRVDIPIEQA